MPEDALPLALIFPWVTAPAERLSGDDVVPLPESVES